MSLVLTPDQRTAHDQIVEFFSRPILETDEATYLHLLTGGAGSGKTTLTKELIRSARKAGFQILLVAPTHKARRVLHNIVNTHSFLRTPTATVASLLGKVRAHSYVGTHHYKKEVDDKVAAYDIILIDEVSMITEEDYKDICRLGRTFHKKMLLIGDEAQIPHPNSRYIMHACSGSGSGYLEKAISPAFSLPYCSHLTTTVRAKEQTLVNFYDAVRSRIGTDVKLHEFTSLLDIGSVVTVCQDQAEFANHIARQFKEAKTAKDAKDANKVICYTNNAVKKYNSLVRQSLGYKELQVNEILMGYSNIGMGCGAELIVENGQDYIVTDVKETTAHSLSANGSLFENLTGLLIHMHTSEKKVGGPGLFIPDLDAPANENVLIELVTLAQKVNHPGSKKIDYKHYMALKSQLFFMENIYQYDDSIYTETNFKHQHPLLFTRTTDYLQNGKIEQSERTERLCSIYANILAERLADSKEVSANEELADRYQILEKDLDYGYAITAHKAQGSTYDRVFIDEGNFGTLSDGWSATKRVPIKRVSERDRLKYVVITRARKHIYILTMN